MLNADSIMSTKRQTSSKENDLEETAPINKLPPEMYIAIFSNLDFRETLANCTLVCRRWYEFLTGNMFWTYLLYNEFGQRFMIGDDVVTFRRAVTTSSLFRRPTVCSTSDNNAGINIGLPCGNMPVKQLKCVGNRFRTPHQFIENCRENYSHDWLRSIHIGVAYLKSKHKWWLVNIAKLLPGWEIILDILKVKLPIAFAANCDLSQEYEAVFTIILLDANFEVLQEVARKGAERNDAVVLDYPTGVRYLAFRDDWTLGCRFIFPRHARRLIQNIDFLEAVVNGNVDAMCRLLDEGIDVNTCKDRHGDCALILAASTGHHQLITVLVRYGAQVDARDRHGNTALIRSVTSSYNGPHALDVQMLTIKALAECGASFIAKNNNGQTALHAAAFDVYTQHHRRLLNVKHLIESGADVNQGDSDGNSILMVAVKRRRTREMRHFIERFHVDVNVKNNENETPLSLATKMGDKAVIDMLRNSGAQRLELFDN